MFWVNFECPGDHLGGYVGAILVILAVRASIWTPRGSPNAIYRQITTPKWNYGVNLGHIFLTFLGPNIKNRGPKTESEKNTKKERKKESLRPSKTELSIESGFKIDKIRSIENRLYVGTFLGAKVSTILLVGVSFFLLFF